MQAGTGHTSLHSASALACIWPQFSARVGTPPPVAITQFLKGDSSCRTPGRVQAGMGRLQEGMAFTCSALQPHAAQALSLPVSRKQVTAENNTCTAATGPLLPADLGMYERPQLIGDSKQRTA